MNLIGVVLVVLIDKVLCVGIGSASGYDKTVTGQVVNETDSFHKSTLWNDSAKNSDTFMPNNSSVVEGNVTSNISERLSTRDIRTIYAPVGLTLGIWSIVANGLPLAAIIKQEQLHKPVYILMANLAASDVLTGVAFVLSGSAIQYYIDTDTIPSTAMIRFLFTSIFLSGLSSAYSLMALTAERYWFIVHGMTYINNVTIDKCNVVIMIVWFWSSLLVMLPVLGWRCEGQFEDGSLPMAGGLPYSYVVVFLVFMFIPMAAIILVNMGVFYCLWKHINEIGAQEAAVDAQPSASRKSAITLVLITVVFLVGWLPMFGRMALITADITARAKMYVFIIINSAINPVIYGFRLKEVRHGVARLFVNSGGNVIIPDD